MTDSIFGTREEVEAAGVRGESWIQLIDRLRATALALMDEREGLRNELREANEHAEILTREMSEHLESCNPKIIQLRALLAESTPTVAGTTGNPTKIKCQQIRSHGPCHGDIYDYGDGEPLSCEACGNPPAIRGASDDAELPEWIAWAWHSAQETLQSDGAEGEGSRLTDAERSHATDVIRLVDVLRATRASQSSPRASEGEAPRCPRCTVENWSVDTLRRYCVCCGFNMAEHLGLIPRAPTGTSDGQEGQ